MVYLQLLYSYLKIGFFGFGGGYAMLALIQNEIVVRHHCYFADDAGAHCDQQRYLCRLYGHGEYLGFVAGNFCSQPAFAYDHAADHQILYGTA